MNQEIGYAFSRRNELGIFPIVERGLEIKGFVHKSRENIELDNNDIASAIYRVLTVLRGYINRNLETITSIHVTCPKCESTYRLDLPSQDEINSAVEGRRVIATHCDVCKTQNILSPQTFEVVESIKIAR